MSPVWKCRSFDDFPVAQSIQDLLVIDNRANQMFDGSGYAPSCVEGLALGPRERESAAMTVDLGVLLIMVLRLIDVEGAASDLASGELRNVAFTSNAGRP
jgi:hypothetical protein